MPLWPFRSAPRPAVQRTDAEWIAAVRAHDAAALSDLRLVLLQALRPTLRRLAPAQAEALGEDLAQEALVRITGAVNTFRGEARFTTWAAKVAVRLAFSELRRHKWRDVSLDGLLAAAPNAAPDAAPLPDAALEEADGVRLVRALVAEVLTERQRTALEAHVIHGMPLEVVADRMDTNRNALYKLLFDARARLKAALDSRGLAPDDLFPDG